MQEYKERDVEQSEPEGHEDHIDWLYYPAVGAVEGDGTEKVKGGSGFIEKLIGWWHWLLTDERYEKE